ncbi:MAG: AAA family ATPase [Moorea sp. SIO3I7]|nr:AAA family ATPase [Moorena sp. SIO3I7]
MPLNQKQTESIESIELSSGIRYGLSAVDGWLPLVEQPLFILVGLTGVGKSTLINALSDTELNFTLFPNRRTLTDKFIIPTVMQIDGAEKEDDITCRVTRFSYTRRYKQLFPEGIVHILSKLQINPSQVCFPLLFDGLRGKQEVKYAIKILPKAQFLVLEAPNYVRLERLLTRRDLFDRITQSSPIQYNYNENKISSFSELGIPQDTHLFAHEQTQEILAKVNKGYFSINDLRDCLKIIVAEKCNYNPYETRSILEDLAPSRTLFINTTSYAPHLIAQEVQCFLSSG